VSSLAFFPKPGLKSIVTLPTCLATSNRLSLNIGFGLVRSSYLSVSKRLLRPLQTEKTLGTQAPSCLDALVCSATPGRQCLRRKGGRVPRVSPPGSDCVRGEPVSTTPLPRNEGASSGTFLQGKGPLKQQPVVMREARTWGLETNT
jgi:hypothetical protein